MKLVSLFKLLLVIVYAAAAVLVVVFLLPFSGYKTLTVATGSMTPAIRQGSLVIIHRAPASALHVGDVVTYINPRNTSQTITHRIVQKSLTNNLPTYITKGDANKVDDPQILGGNIVGKVEFHSLVAGKIIGLIRTPVGLVLLVIIPALLIIVDEIRRLTRTLVRADQEGRKKDDVPTNPESVSTPVLSTTPIDQEVTSAIPPPTPKHRPVRIKRNIDSIIVRAVTIIAVMVVVSIGSTYATLTSSPATLTGNTISGTVPVVPPPPTSHLEINRVGIGAAASSTTCPGSSSSISISNTAPGSTNNASVNTNCSITSSGSSSVTIINNNSQTTSTGSTTETNNTTSSGATSGSASNSSSTNTNVSITNGTVSGTAAFVELYNPTSSAIDLSTWKLVDNSGTPRTLTGTITAHGLTLISGTFGDGLTGNGDRMILENGSAVVDAVSWGSDTSQLNPAVASIPVGGSIERKTLGVDTDAASDWQVVGP